jgi:ribosomal protein L32
MANKNGRTCPKCGMNLGQKHLCPICDSPDPEQETERFSDSSGQVRSEGKRAGRVCPKCGMNLGQKHLCPICDKTETEQEKRVENENVSISVSAPAASGDGNRADRDNIAISVSASDHTAAPRRRKSSASSSEPAAPRRTRQSAPSSEPEPTPRRTTRTASEPAAPRRTRQSAPSSEPEPRRTTRTASEPAAPRRTRQSAPSSEPEPEPRRITKAERSDEPARPEPGFLEKVRIKKKTAVFCFIGSLLIYVGLSFALNWIFDISLVRCFVIAAAVFFILSIIALICSDADEFWNILCASGAGLSAIALVPCAPKPVFGLTWRNTLIVDGIVILLLLVCSALDDAGDDFMEKFIPRLFFFPLPLLLVCGLVSWYFALAWWWIALIALILLLLLNKLYNY